MPGGEELAVSLDRDGREGRSVVEVNESAIVRAIGVVALQSPVARHHDLSVGLNGEVREVRLLEHPAVFEPPMTMPSSLKLGSRSPGPPWRTRHETEGDGDGQQDSTAPARTPSEEPSHLVTRSSRERAGSQTPNRSRYVRSSRTLA